MQASVQRIAQIRTHPNADSLELAKILGWQVVVKKGEFKPGDLCFYIEVDSVCPEIPEFEFLRSKKFRVKAIKLRGELSEGLALPISEGMDVTTLTGVKKFEKYIPPHLSGIVRGLFPHFIPKTDETRIESVPGLIEEMEWEPCYSSIKMDGTSATFLNRDGDLHVCSRNLSMKLEDENSVYVRAGKMYGLPEKLIGRNIAVQGEICGPSIQKNPWKLPGLDFFVFNLYDIDKSTYLGFEEMQRICEELGLKTVPIMDTFVFRFRSIEELKKYARIYYADTDNPIEGVVIRSVREQFSETLKGRMSFKVINPDYEETE